MDYAAAENAAKQALRLSRISGHLRSEFAAIIDLAHVWIQFGRLDDAGRMLRRASNMCDLSPRCRDCVRDGLAQLELHRGNLGSSRHLVDEVLASTSPRHAYPRVWGALTKAEMLLRQGLYQECQAQCEAALAALPVPTDKGLALRLRLILSEVLAQSGSFTEAGRVAVRARQDAANSSLGLLAELNHRIANVLSLGGLELQAEALEDRAQRLVAPTRQAARRRNDPPRRDGPRPGGRAGPPRRRCAHARARSHGGDLRAGRPAGTGRGGGGASARRPRLLRAMGGRARDRRQPLCRRSQRPDVAGRPARSAQRPGGVLHRLVRSSAGTISRSLAEPRPSIAATESLAAVLRLARHYASAQAGQPPIADDDAERQSPRSR